MTVRHWDTSHVPEDQQEAEFLLVHVPGCNNEVLTLGTSIGVSEVGHYEEEDLARDVAVLFILPCSGCAAQAEENEPRDADFVEHLEI